MVETVIDQDAQVAGGAPTVLVVEHDDALRTIFVRLVLKSGCLAYSASSGHEALAALAERHYDLILLDGHLPDDFSRVVARFVRRIESLAGTPIVVTATDDTSEQIARLVEAGADEVVIKPILAARLRDILETYAFGPRREGR